MNLRALSRTVAAFPWYPLLVALLPAARFHEANFRSFFLRDYLRIEGFYLVLAGIILLGCSALWRDRHRGALIAAPLLVVILSGNELGGLSSLLILIVTVFGGIFLAIRKPNPARLSGPLNATVLVLVILPLANAWWSDRGLQPPVPTAVFREPLPTNAAAGTLRPDIWYLLVDGLGAPRLVEEKFGLDPSRYSDQLRQRGFQLPALSHSNYQQTGLSVAATWNVAHIPTLLAVPDTSSHDRRPLYTLIGNNRVVRALRGLGYAVVDLPSSYPMTRLRQTDAVLEPAFSPNMVDYSLLAQSILPLLQPVLGRGPADLSFALRRRSLNYIFDELPRARQAVPADQPTLVFAHILAPHPPFVFKADGSPRRSERPFGFFDGSHWLDRHGWAAGHYRPKYAAQAAYVMRRLGEDVDRILAQATRPTIIIVQGDHGPGSGLDWERPAHSDHRERSAILNAWYLPPELKTECPATMTSLDTFPFIFQRVFGIPLGSPPDSYLISRWSRPYIFYQIAR